MEAMHAWKDAWQMCMKGTHERGIGMHGRDVWVRCMHAQRGCIKGMHVCMEGVHSHCQQVWDEQELPAGLCMRTFPPAAHPARSPLCNRSERGESLAKGLSQCPRDRGCSTAPILHSTNLHGGKKGGTKRSSEEGSTALLHAAMVTTHQDPAPFHCWGANPIPDSSLSQGFGGQGPLSTLQGEPMVPPSPFPAPSPCCHQPPSALQEQSSSNEVITLQI